MAILSTIDTDNRGIIGFHGRLIQSRSEIFELFGEHIRFEFKASFDSLYEISHRLNGSSACDGTRFLKRAAREEERTDLYVFGYRALQDLITCR